MPVSVSYPGVYIEEIPSGVHTIVGVATSITAFLGQAAKGPIDRAVTVFSYSDFVRQFGDLDVNYPMGFAVRDFFLNGGSQGVIVRLYKNPADAAKKPSASLKAGTGTQLALIASSPGDWANGLQARVDHDVNEEVATALGLTKNDLFNLSVRLMPDGQAEQFFNVTVKDSARRVDRVLAAESSLARVNGALGADVPGDSGKDAQGNPVWEAVQDADKGNPSDALDSTSYAGDRGKRTGKYLLEDVDLFNLVCVFGNALGTDVDKVVYSDVLAYCVERRAFLLVDPPVGWKHGDLVSNPTGKLTTDVNLTGTNARNAAIYYPRLDQANPLHNNHVEVFAASGTLAGLLARTDADRGVWKAPAGIDVALSGVVGLADNLTDRETGALNQVGINVLRTFPVYGQVVWGARTLRGADRIGDEYKYIPVRRTALFLEESLYRGLQWVVFEPNDEPLWAQIRLNIGAFLQSLFRQGAFQGKSPREAYFVKCDSETTTQANIDTGVVNIVVGFAPLKPAEFVIVQLQQMAGQIAT
jgi:uncharacterized protein